MSDLLGSFEQLVLLAILRLRENAYGRRIHEEIQSRLGKPTSLGAVYLTLERLEGKGYVTSAFGDATPSRGGRPKRYFDIAAPGEAALRDTRATIDGFWQGVAVRAGGLQ